MNDYHSAVEPMPSIEVRKESLKNYATLFMNTKNISEEELNRIIHFVVCSTAEYSACGYWIFGIKQEHELLSKYVEVL